MIEKFERDGLIGRSRDVGARLQQGLRDMAARHPAIGDVRGLGAMVAVELFKPGSSGAHREPDVVLTQAVVKAAAQAGLILLSCGTYGNVIRVLVPLTASDALLDEGLAILAECFDRCR